MLASFPDSQAEAMSRGTDVREVVDEVERSFEELRRDLPTVRDRHDSQAEAMSRGTDVREVVDEVERSFDEPRGPERGQAR